MAKNVEQMLAERGQGTAQTDPWKVRCWRELRGMSQHELASACGLGERGNETICRIEAWAIQAGSDRTATLASALRTSRSSLQSPAAELAVSRQRYDDWCAAGRPDLGAWLRSRGT